MLQCWTPDGLCCPKCPRDLNVPKMARVPSTCLRFAIAHLNIWRTIATKITTLSRLINPRNYVKFVHHVKVLIETFNWLIMAGWRNKIELVGSGVGDVGDFQRGPLRWSSYPLSRPPSSTSWWWRWWPPRPSSEMAPSCRRHPTVFAGFMGSRLLHACCSPSEPHDCDYLHF